MTLSIPDHVSLASDLPNNFFYFFLVVALALAAMMKPRFSVAKVVSHYQAQGAKQEKRNMSNFKFIIVRFFVITFLK
jgi:hypothetical protein